MWLKRFCNGNLVVGISSLLAKQIINRDYNFQFEVLIERFNHNNDDSIELNDTLWGSYRRNRSINLSIFIDKFTDFDLSQYYRRSLNSNQGLPGFKGEHVLVGGGEGGLIR